MEKIPNIIKYPVGLLLLVAGAWIQREYHERSTFKFNVGVELWIAGIIVICS